MGHYAGIDVSLKDSTLCIMDDSGGITKEGKALSDPASLHAFLSALPERPALVGLEAGPMSQWLYDGLVAAGWTVVLMETRHVRSVTKAMPVKTDRSDAKGMANMLRCGWYNPVHCKSPPARDIRTLLDARRLLIDKTNDIEKSLRGLLRGYGLKVGIVSAASFANRVRELANDHSVLGPLSDAMLRAVAVLRIEIAALTRKIRVLAKADPICHRLMTMPGVGPIVALTYKATIDDPGRFKTARAVGAHLGLTPRRYQSGETDTLGRISKCGDAMARAALYEGALVLLTRSNKNSALKAWGLRISKRRGIKRALVAVARKMAVVLHCMWRDGTDFRYAA